MTVDPRLAELFGARTALVVPDVVDARAAAAARARLAPRWRRYDLVDRGSYDVVDDLDDPALREAIEEVAAVQLGRPHGVSNLRALRLVAGDYLLAHHDRVHAGQPIEAVLDVSAAAVPGADVRYRRRGEVYFVAPAVPGTMILIERGPTVTSDHAYVSRRHAGAEVVRVVALLRPG